ncbi:MAG: helix-turn-helix transcriptional regulator [Halomonas sp.]|uniref:helix-turn-helix domain-containing protein n=1 Tax=Halomonas sp. TaxID=1486246 RepID=UPI002ACE7CDB|nr:helix-turn-helix transcriptional regulator [Halomonas sp.]MDZ7852198.1 helix-turn-helix transcriptional regulator [Halomonas sp.]
MDSLGPRIKELRLEAKLNKAALARRVGVSDVTISYWESGAIRQIGHERLVALAQALNCPLSRLLEETGTQATPLFLHSHPPLPWHDGRQKGIDLPIELVPGQRWDGDCHLVTPAPGEHFDFLAEGDLVAIAPSEIFRQPGLYLIDDDGTLAIRRVDQANTGELVFHRKNSDEAMPWSPACRLVGKLVAHWRLQPL